MNATTLERRFRTFLLVVSASVFLGTIVELWLAKHTKSSIQFVPFVLCGVGLIAVVAVLLRPRRATLFALRGVMLTLIGGSALGIYEHLAGNWAFVVEIRPTATPSEVLLSALRGAAPLLAPGILALAGVIALAATYYHPALGNRADVPSPASDERGAQARQAVGGNVELQARDS